MQCQEQNENPFDVRYRTHHWLLCGSQMDRNRNERERSRLNPSAREPRLAKIHPVLSGFERISTPELAIPRWWWNELQFWIALRSGDAKRGCKHDLPLGKPARKIKGALASER